MISNSHVGLARPISALKELDSEDSKSKTELTGLQFLKQYPACKREKMLAAHPTRERQERNACAGIVTSKLYASWA